MIHVLAQIRAQPGRRDELIQEFHGLVPAVRAEAGCIEYGPTVDAATTLDRQDRDENRVVMVERWESLEDLERHLQAPHMLAFRERVRDLVASSQLQIVEGA